MYIDRSIDTYTCVYICVQCVFTNVLRAHTHMHIHTHTHTHVEVFERVCFGGSAVISMDIGIDRSIDRH